MAREGQERGKEGRGGKRRKRWQGLGAHRFCFPLCVLCPGPTPGVLPWGVVRRLLLLADLERTIMA